MADWETVQHVDFFIFGDLLRFYSDSGMCIITCTSLPKAKERGELLRLGHGRVLYHLGLGRFVVVLGEFLGAGSILAAILGEGLGWTEAEFNDLSIKRMRSMGEIK